jgi:hypothetical protein
MSANESAASSASMAAGDINGEAPLQKYLHKNGLVASQIDPSSLQALRDMFRESLQRGQTVPAPGTSLLDSSSRSLLEMASNSYPSVRDFVIPESATPVERLILEQLRNQTALLHHLQRQLAQQHQQRASSAENGKSFQQVTIQISNSSNGPQFATRAAPATTQAHPPAPQPRIPAVPLPSLWQRSIALLRNLRSVKILTLYTQLLRARLERNRQNNPALDPLMLIKILVMLAILISRLAPARKRPAVDGKQSWSWNTQFVLVGTVVVLGFLHQTGVLSFWYQFCFVHQYPMRIWKGEDITLEQALEQQQRAAVEQGARPGPQHNHWLAALIFGAPPPERVPPPPQRPNPAIGNAPAAVGMPEIPPPPQAAAAPPVSAAVQLLQDIVVVLMSFVLSIFPMWRAIGPARPQPPPPMRQPEAQPDPDALPAVRPPVDLADFEEDDDEDSDDNEDDDDDDADVEN